MDDWNDFGAGPGGAQDGPVSSYPQSNSSRSTEASVSDSSLALLDSGPSSAASRHTPEHSTSSASLRDTAVRDNEDHSSFLSLPFRRSTRQKVDRRPTSAAGSALNERRSEYVDDAMVPVTASEHPDRQAGDVETMSSASESLAQEPISTRMPVSRVAMDPNVVDESMDDEQSSPGDLDDVSDDYEMNVSGMHFWLPVPKSHSVNDDDPQSSSRIASALLSRAEKKYTKLEVISSKQIKHIVLFFFLFVVSSIIANVTILVCVNGPWKNWPVAIPVPQALLTQEQIDANIPPGPVPFGVDVIGSEPGPRSSGSAGSSTHHRPNNRKRFLPQSVVDLGKKVLAAKGLYMTPDGLEKGPVVPLETSRVLAEGGDADSSMVPHLWLRNSSFAPPNAGSMISDMPSESLRQVNGGELSSPPAPLTDPSAGSTPVIISSFVEVASMTQPRRHTMAAHFIMAILSVTFLTLAVLFAVRIVRQGRRNVSHEQIWVLILIFLTGIYFNVLESAVRLVELFGVEGRFGDRPKPLLVFGTIVVQFRDVAFAGFCFFYLWASLHSYRILDSTEKLGWRFYVPKIVILSAYVVFKLLARMVMRIMLSEIPLVSGPAFGFYFSNFRVWNYLRAEVLYAVATTLIEALLVCIICYEAVLTSRALEKVPYMKYRSKRVGFRFFSFINLVFYPLFLTLSLMLVFWMPKGVSLSQISLGTDLPSADVPWFLTIGPAVLVAGYVLTTAHVHLPANSVGVVKGWFVSSKLASSGLRWSFTSEETKLEKPPSSASTSVDPDRELDATWIVDDETPRSIVDNDDELEQEIVEPITYRKRESKDALELRANCFTMQTHVIMFNFAWYVYYYGTAKLDSFRPKENPLPFQYQIAGHVKCDATDTQALVADCSDRIIVTFKGTTSMRNLKTSLHMSHERLQSVVRTNVYGEDESARLKRLFGRHYSNAKIHRGFAIAYQSVADEVMELVRVLRGRKQRPVFLTGHSLGGALATLCSLDLWVKLDVSRREIFVSTFGSPRVGNSDFAEVYRVVVPLHWRIVVDPDMVPKLPYVGYAHVGKKVVLTPHGDMLIDRNALETRLWSGERAGLAYHRKASYLLAMRAWCVRHHGMTYTPVFWPFPVRQDDARRFAGAFEDVDDRKSGAKVASKIIHMDAMVDALGAGDTELADMAVVHKWGRLTRRLLLNDKLTAAARERAERQT